MKMFDESTALYLKAEKKGIIINHVWKDAKYAYPLVYEPGKVGTVGPPTPFGCPKYCPSPTFAEETITGETIMGETIAGEQNVTHYPCIDSCSSTPPQPMHNPPQPIWMSEQGESLRVIDWTRNNLTGIATLAMRVSGETGNLKVSSMFIIPKKVILNRDWYTPYDPNSTAIIIPNAKAHSPTTYPVSYNIITTNYHTTQGPVTFKGNDKIKVVYAKFACPLELFNDLKNSTNTIRYYWDKKDIIESTPVSK
jgi:hypothetical protein